MAGVYSAHQTTATETGICSGDLVKMDYIKLTGIAHARLHPGPILSRGLELDPGASHENVCVPTAQDSHAFRKTFTRLKGKA